MSGDSEGGNDSAGGTTCAAELPDSVEQLTVAALSNGTTVAAASVEVEVAGAAAGAAGTDEDVTATLLDLLNHTSNAHSWPTPATANDALSSSSGRDESFVTCPTSAGTPTPAPSTTKHTDATGKPPMDANTSFRSRTVADACVSGLNFSSYSTASLVPGSDGADGECEAGPMPVAASLGPGPVDEAGAAWYTAVDGVPLGTEVGGGSVDDVDDVEAFECAVMALEDGVGRSERGDKLRMVSLAV